MALVFLEEDPWLSEYESCEKLQRDIMEQLTLRQKYLRTTDKYAQVSANIRIRLKQYYNEVSQLNQKLDVSSLAGALTQQESERRKRQIEVLHSKAVHMQKIFDEQMMDKVEKDRKELIEGAGSSAWGNGREPERVQPNASTSEIQAYKKRMLQEQDNGLENLSSIISRQKNIASVISNEVDYHNEILDGLGTQIDRTDHRVRNETQHIDSVDRSDKTCIYWVVIIVLFISIIVVAVV